MKLLHVIPTYVPAWRYGGPIWSVHGLCRTLAALGHEVHVFTTSVDGDSNLEVPVGTPIDVDGVKVWYFPSPRYRRIYWSPAMKQALRRYVPSFDIVHLHSLFLWPTWKAARTAEDAGVPYAVSPRGMMVKSLVKRKSRLAKTAWISFVEKHTLEHAAFIHVTSDIEEMEMSRFGYSFPSIINIPNGIGYEDFSVAGEDESGNPFGDWLSHERIVLFLGRINWKKGLDRLIPAMAGLQDVLLVIAGNDEDAYIGELERLAHNMGVSDRVIFTGPVYGNAKQTLLKTAKILALPSYSENFGNVVVEAMAVGCPVLVTKDVGLASVVEACGAGIVTLGEPESIGIEITRLLEDALLRRRMGEQGRKLVSERFSWTAIAGQMLKTYEAVVFRGRL